MNHDLETLRRDYQLSSLVESDAGHDPVALFKRWLQDAKEAKQLEPNAMTLATVDAFGRPHARIVLLKGCFENRFSFYTNYLSHKGQQIKTNPLAALCFWWDHLERQIRIEGKVRKLSADESDVYFNIRPRGSRLGAWASAQSEVIKSHEILESKMIELEEVYPEEIPRPAHWGGYEVIADRIEFWQGRSSRLNDRLDFTKSGNGWNRVRRSP